jgi:hypothetical protein
MVRIALLSLAVACLSHPARPELTKSGLAVAVLSVCASCTEHRNNDE